MTTTPLPKDYTQEWTTIQGVDFTIPTGVFIPRPETERWLEKVIDQYQNYFDQVSTIVDLCSGAGLIGVMISKHYPTKHIISLEYNPLAVEAQVKTFKRNSIQNITVRLSNLFDAVTAAELSKPWILISNPPYVPEGDKEFLKQNNIEHEPMDAIFGGGKNGLDMYKRILTEITKLPLPLFMVFELDPRNILTASKIAKKMFAGCTTHHISDVNGWHRALVIEF